MNRYKQLLAIFCIVFSKFKTYLNIYLIGYFLSLIFKVQFKVVYFLKCRSGFGISEPGSTKIKTFFNNTTPQPDCISRSNSNRTSNTSNPVLRPVGCFVIFVKN